MGNKRKEIKQKITSYRSSRWQKRKLQKLFPPWRHWFNNTQTKSLCKKYVSSVKRHLYPRWLWNQLCWDWQENLWYSLTIGLPQTQWDIIGRKLPALSLSGEGNRKLKHISNVQAFQGAAQETSFYLDWI